MEGGEIFTLAGHEQEPAFAVPVRSEEQSAWLERSLAGLARVEFRRPLPAAREGLTQAPAEGRFASLWRGDPTVLQSLRAWAEAPPRREYLR